MAFRTVRGRVLKVQLSLETGRDTWPLESAHCQSQVTWSIAMVPMLSMNVFHYVSLKESLGATESVEDISHTSQAHVGQVAEASTNAALRHMPLMTTISRCGICCTHAEGTAGHDWRPSFAAFPWCYHWGIPITATFDHQFDSGKLDTTKIASCEF